MPKAIASGRLPILTSAAVDALKREEFKVVFLVEPAALENPDWQADPAGKSKCIDRELNVGVFFLLRFRLVVEDVDLAIPNLQKVDVAGYSLGLEVESEAVSVGSRQCRRE